MKKANKNTPAEQEPPKMPLTRRNYDLLAIGFAVTNRRTRRTPCRKNPRIPLTRRNYVLLAIGFGRPQASS